MMKIKHLCIFLVFLLIIYPVSSVNMYNHFYNGSSWVPALATADGQQKYWIDMANATYGNVVANLTVGERIGIGTKNPTHELNIVGGANITNNLIVKQNFTLGEKIIFKLGETIDNLIDGLVRITGNLNVTHNSNVGGNLSANGNLNVGGNLQVAKNFAINNSDFYVNVTSGDVGIGTESPTHKLNVLGYANITQNVIIGNSLKVGVGQQDYLNMMGAVACLGGYHDSTANPDVAIQIGAYANCTDRCDFYGHGCKGAIALPQGGANYHMLLPCSNSDITWGVLYCCCER